MNAISSYRGNRPTNKQTGVITIHCAAASLVRSVTTTTFGFVFQLIFPELTPAKARSQDQYSGRYSKEPLGIAGARFLQAGCTSRHRAVVSKHRRKCTT